MSRFSYILLINIVYFIISGNEYKSAGTILRKHQIVEEGMQRA
jgi:hypothetical protein